MSEVDLDFLIQSVRKEGNYDGQILVVMMTKQERSGDGDGDDKVYYYEGEGSRLIRETNDE